MARQSGCMYCEKIRENAVDLTQTLQHREAIIEQLHEDDLLTEDEVDELTTTPLSERRKTRELRDMIMTKCNENLHEAFLRTLQVSQQDDLFNKLSEDCGYRNTAPCTALRYRLCHLGLCDVTDVGLPRRLRNKLERAEDTLVKEMDYVSEISEQLESEGCLPVDQAAEHLAQSERVRRLVRSVVTLFSYLMLVAYLNITQQTALYRSLTEDHMPTLSSNLSRLRYRLYLKKFKDHFLTGRDPLDTTLQYKYVPLTVITEKEAPNRRGMQQEFVFDRLHGNTIPLEKIFSQTTLTEEPESTRGKNSGRVLLIGAPGAGKTFAAHQLRTSLLNGECHMPKVEDPLPILIPLRTMDNRDTTLRKLLLRNGPHMKDKEEEEATWRALMEHQRRVVLILDGADESQVNFLDAKQALRVVSPEQKASSKDILSSLLSGHLLKLGTVILSSRPFNLEQPWKYFAKKFEIRGFDVKHLFLFLKNELNVQQFVFLLNILTERWDLVELCLLPLHAATLAQMVKFRGAEKMNLLGASDTGFTTQMIESYLMQTRGELKGEVKTSKAVWSANYSVLKKLSGLAVKGQSGVQVTFTGQSLDAAGIDSRERASCGLLSGNFAEFERAEGAGVEETYELPHKSVAEWLAALGLANGPWSTIQHLVDMNRGDYDIVLILLAGLTGDVKYHELLTAVGDEPHTDQRQRAQFYRQRAYDVAAVVLSAVKRVDEIRRIFCLRVLHASQQWSILNRAQEMIGTGVVWVRNRQEAVCLREILARHPDFMPVVIPTDSDLLNDLFGVKYLRCDLPTYIQNDNLPDTLPKLHTLHGLCLDGRAISSARLIQVIHDLSRLASLTTLVLVMCPVGGLEASTPSVMRTLHTLTRLTTLVTISCDLDTEDVISLLRDRGDWPLRYLEISDNETLDLKGITYSDVEGLEAVHVKGCDVACLVEALTHHTNASLVSFSSTEPLSDASCRRLEERCPNMRQLSVHNQRILSQLPADSRVTHVEQFGRGELTSAVLTTGLQRSSLTNLTLTGCDLSPSCVNALAASHLHTLYIRPPRYRRLPNNIARLTKATKLKELWLDGVLTASQLSEIFRGLGPLLHTLGVRLHDEPGEAYPVSRREVSVDELRRSVGQLTRPLSHLYLTCRVNHIGFYKEGYVELCAELDAVRPGMTSLRPVGYPLTSLHKVYFTVSEAWQDPLTPQQRALVVC